MPELHEPQIVTTDLTDSEPLEIGAPGFGGGSTIPGEPAAGLSVGGPGALPTADPTGRPVVRGRRWYKGLGWGFWVAVVWVVLWIVAAIFAGFLPIDAPSTIFSNCVISNAPSSSHLLGCDNIGQDILSQVIYGSRVSL
ncbi:MAG: hypothetical protein ACRDZP_01630, partial [Acidimicrobiales bacterium]